RNQHLNEASNMLGGQKLRVFRDNMKVMTRNALNVNGKPPPRGNSNTDGSTSSTSYANAKLSKTKQRVKNMQQEMYKIESKEVDSSNELMHMLLLFQNETERRGEVEDRRRWIEREDRYEGERCKRTEIRREEADKRRLEELARELREEQRRITADKYLKLEREREGNRRLFGERLTLECSEVSQRHE
ncbi:hypothetical protein PHMEG_00028339, partial [Phytophthora megakarya]